MRQHVTNDVLASVSIFILHTITFPNLYFLGQMLKELEFLVKLSAFLDEK